MVPSTGHVTAAMFLRELRGHDEPVQWWVLPVTRAQTLTPIMPWVRTPSHTGPCGLQSFLARLPRPLTCSPPFFPVLANEEPCWKVRVPSRHTWGAGHALHSPGRAIPGKEEPPVSCCPAEEQRAVGLCPQC